MSRRKLENTENDRGAPLRREADRERQEEEGQESRPVARRDGNGSGDRSVPEERRKNASLKGRPPSSDPDVFLDIPEVKVDEIYLNVEELDAHLSLQARLANLVQLVAGVHVHLGKVELDVKGVEAEALLKIRLENIYDVIDRALSTVDRNPQLVEGMIKTVDGAVDEVGQTAERALGPEGAVSKTADQAGDAAKRAVGPGGAVTKTGQQAGQAVDDTAEGVADAAEEVSEGVDDVAGTAREELEEVEQPGRGPRRSGEREANRGSKRGTRLSRFSDDEGEEGRPVSRAARVGEAPRQALDSDEETDEEADEVIESVDEDAVEASGRASWTPKKANSGWQGAEPRRRPSSRRSREAETEAEAAPRRGTRPQSSTRNRP
jgi:hypothetical protein